MAATGYRNIIIFGEPTRTEKLAASGSAVQPGHLLEMASGEYQEHSTADGYARKLFALENQTHDIADGANLATAYVAGGIVYAGEFKQGDIVYARVATGQSLVEGVSILVSNGDGTLKIDTLDATDLVGKIVAVAGETKTTSTAGELSRVIIQ